MSFQVSTLISVLLDNDISQYQRVGAITLFFPPPVGFRAPPHFSRLFLFLFRYR